MERMRTVLLCWVSLWFTAAAVGQEQASSLTVEQRLQLLEAQLRSQQQGGATVETWVPTKEDAKRYPTWQVNGVINADAGWYTQTEGNRAQVGDLEDGAAFRRARLGVAGLVSEHVSYEVQMDFAARGRPSFTDVCFTLNDVPGVGHVRFGQWKHPYSLEVVTSFLYNPWLERSPVFLLSPVRHIGIGIFDHTPSELFTWGLSVIRPGNDQYGGDLSDTGGIGVVGRLTWAPVYDCDGERVLHFGGAFYVAAPSNNTFQIGATGGNAPEFAMILGTTIQPSFVDTGVIATNNYDSVQAETALVWGPFSVQAEGAYSYLTQIGGAPLHFFAGYVGASYFLTGEHRNYDPKRGAFGPIKVLNEYHPCKNGLALGGAWELTARLSYIDATDENIEGGVLTDVTAGVNWWLNTNTRFSFNYIHCWLDRQPTGQTEANVFAVRAQVDF